MALLDGPRYCQYNHRDCGEHGATKIDPATLPGLDRAPREARCIAGHMAPVWIVPIDGHAYCRKHLRMVLRIATYPDAMRFPEDA